MEENQFARILVVDDEDRIRRLLRMYLERENYEIEEAENGDEALELALNNEYDLIMLDVMMPGIDGVEVCKQLREKKATPIIMLTAKGEEANRVQGFEAGVDDYIVKPFEAERSCSKGKSITKKIFSNFIFENRNKSKKCNRFSSFINRS